ncbi:hypothetical protein JCM11251_004471 [Rhodosporidiobolus azoricus]
MPTESTGRLSFTRSGRNCDARASSGVELHAQVLAQAARQAKGSRAVQWSDVWTAATDSIAMRRLVEQRDEIFTKQRSFTRSYPDLISYDLAASHLAQFSAANTVPRLTFVAYHRFCQLYDIPVFPITPASLALCVFNRCSIIDNNPETFRSELERLRQATATVWQADPVYADLLTYEDGTALREFMRNCRRVQKRKRDETVADGDASLQRRSATSLHYAPSSDPEGTASSDEMEEEELVFEPADPNLVEQLDCPGIPRPGSIWPSFDALYSALFVSTVSIYGTGIAITNRGPSAGQIQCNRAHTRNRTRPGGICTFRVDLEYDEAQGGWRVSEGVSELRHNHGADPRIISDPTWRPLVKNPLAKAALAAADAGQSPFSFEHSAFPTRRPRPNPASAVSSFSPATPSDPPTKALPPAPSPASHFPPSSASDFPSSSVLHSLSVFLVALNPSLSALGPHLLAACLDSQNALTELALLDPQWVDLFVETLRMRSEDEERRPRGSERITVLQARLFAKAVKGLQ